LPVVPDAVEPGGWAILDGEARGPHACDRRRIRKPAESARQFPNIRPAPERRHDREVTDMSPAPSQVTNPSPADRDGARRKSPGGAARKARLRHRALEALEERALMATIPAAVTTGLVDLSAAASPTTSDESAPSVAVNQANPLQLAAAWTRRDPGGNLGLTSAGNPIQTVTQATFSQDGGNTWGTLPLPDRYLDPTTSNPVEQFWFADAVSTAFDRSNHLYVLVDTHNAGYTAGALILYKFDVSGASPRAVDLNPSSPTRVGKVVYEWDPTLVTGTLNLEAVQAWDPALAVDDNVASFTDPSRGTYTQADPYTGNVYVAWTVYDPAITVGPRAYGLAVTASSDGGNTFKAPVFVNDGGGVRTPSLAVSQGRPADPANGLAAIPGGTVSFTWDDYFSAAQASPPQSLIMNDHANAVVAQGFNNRPALPISIRDAVDPGNNLPHLPSTTDFPITVNLDDPRFTTIDRLDVDLSINHPAINELSIVLIPPAGSGLAPIVLLNNGTDAGGAGTGLGATGNGLGSPISAQGSLDTIFSDQANAWIRGNGGGAASLGYFLTDNFFNPGEPKLSDVRGKTAAQLSGTWTLEVTDFRAGNAGSLAGWGLKFSAGMNPGVITPVSDSAHYLANRDGDLTVDTSTVIGADPGGAAPTIVPQSPIPIMATPVLASNNTLGAYSPYEGKTYIAYTDRYDILRDNPLGNGNPADNTDIRLRVVDLVQTPLGPRWQVVGGSNKVNDDDAAIDGHTAAVVSLARTTGRAQFLPSIAVDQTTGTLVMTWYDGRDDASNARVATYLTSSIDGGATFSSQTFVNAANAPYDESLRRAVTLGPITDNQSAGNPLTETVYGFGPHQGLAVYGGRAYPIWSGNQNAGVRGITRLDALLAIAQIAGGPRVVASTMGPVRGQVAVDLATGARIDFNNRTDSAGVPIADGFLVTFDRPVDPSTFTIDDVNVFYRDAGTPGTSPGVPIAVLSVTPVDSGRGLDPAATAFERQFGATQFLVRFADSSFVGTYSYTVGPNINDRIRAPLSTQAFYAPKNAQNMPAIADASLNQGVVTPSITTSSLDINLPAGTVIQDVNVVLSLAHQRDSDLRIRLIPPPGLGLTPIILANGLGGNTGQNFTDTTFDDQAALPITFGAAPFQGEYQSQSGQLDRFNGLSPNGTWKLEITDSRFSASGQLLGWGLVLTTRTTAAGGVSQAGNLMDQNADGVGGEDPAGSPIYSVSPGDVYAAPLPSGVNADGPDQPVIFGGSLARDGHDFSPTYTSTSLPLQVSGPRLATSAHYDAKTGQTNLPVPDAVQNPDLTITPGVLISTITVGGDPNLQVTDLNVRVTIAHARVGDLQLYLVAPDGTTTVPLALNDDGTGFDGTTFDDQATTSIDFAAGALPPYAGKYPGSFIPAGSLTALAGQSLAGAWTLRVEDRTPGQTGTLVAWSIDAQTTSVFRDQAAAALTVKFDRDMDPASIVGPDSIIQVLGPDGRPIAGGVTVVAAPNLDPAYPDPDQNFPRTYRVILPPSARYSGTYVARIAPTAASKDGNQLDTNQNAGLDNLRGTPSQGTQPITYNSTAAVPIGGGASGEIYSSSIDVPDNFLIQNVVVQLNVTFPDDTKLEAYLLAPDGVTEIQLFKNLPARGANFANTILDDFAPTPITNAGPPYSGRYAPQPGLGGTLGNLVGLTSQGTWRLVIKVDAASTAGTINSWKLTLARPLSNSGLGESVADRADAGFRVFTMDPTNPLASSTWTAVGPAGIGAKGANLNAEVAGRVNDVTLDTSDPTGNTAFAATPGGGLWKTTNFLTDAPTGPTWLPLLDNAPIYGLAVSSIAVFPRNGDPNQTVVFAATGDGDASGDSLQGGSTTSSRSTGFLRSLDGGKTWELLDSLNNTLPFIARDHFFASAPGVAGVTTFKLIADPNPVQTDPGTADSPRIILFAAVSDIDGNGQKVTSGPKGGIYRSTDAGLTWTRVRAGEATDVVFDPSSQAPSITIGSGPNQIVRPGNLQFLYAAFRGDGVYTSPNGGDVFNPVLGTTGDPLIQNAGGPQPVPVPVNNTPFGTKTVDPRTPNSAPLPLGEVVNGGQIVLAKPAPTGNAVQDLIYRGWIYAAVVQNVDTMQGSTANVEDFPLADLIGLYLTKDFGQTWTKVALPSDDGLPTNTLGITDPPVTGNGTFQQSPFHLGNFNLALAVDPNNPNVVYLGGTNEFGNSTGLVRVDTTGLHDAHAFFLDQTGSDGGLRYSFVTGSGVALADPTSPPPTFTPPYEPRVNPFLNLIRDPANIFQANATILVQNTSVFENDGGGSKWIPYDRALAPDPFADPTVDPWGVPTRGVHNITTFVDPLTGQSRLIFATDSGIYTVVADASGNFVGSVGGFASLARPDGDTPVVNGSRNGNLQVAQLRDGAAQPSQIAADLAQLRGFFYGSSESTGTSWSDPKVLQAYTVTRDPDTGQITKLTPNPGYGNISWSAIDDRGPSRGGVSTQQELQVIADPNNPGQFIVNDGGAVYFWRSSEGSLNDDGRPSTDTWRVNDVGFTFGLYQSANGGDTPDPQWALRNGYTFAVNPLSGDQAVIGSSAGQVFATKNRGLVWASIGVMADASTPSALAYGSPQPTLNASQLNNRPLALDDYVLVGTQAGHLYASFTGGGTGNGGGNAWLDRSGGLDGSPIRAIVTDPARDSRRAYVVTEKGVYLNNDVFNNASWTPITGNLLGLTHALPLAAGMGPGTEALAKVLTSMAVDWRYVIPDDYSNPNGPTHPVLYVAGQGGVFRSLDNGATWYVFPDPDSPAGTGNLVDPATPVGGNLPNAIVSSLDLSLGSIDPQTGRPNSIDPRHPPASMADSLGPNTLTATTYGRGAFTIRLAPIVFPNQAGQPQILKIDSSTDSGLLDTDQITNVVNPLIDGYSEQTAFGNLVRITLFDLTDPAHPRIIGGYDPSNPATDVAANWTKADGTFQIRVNTGAFVAGGASDGVKTIGVQATNISGTKGNIATFQFTLDTVAPTPALLPVLAAGDDTGLNNGGASNDQITNPVAGAGAGNLDFQITFTPDPTGADTQVTLYRGAAAVGTPTLGLGGAGSPVTVVDPKPITPDATYGYRVKLTDLAGNVSEFSPQLNVRVDTTPPAKPSTPKLSTTQPDANGSDSGVQGDGITNVSQPYFSGQGEAYGLANPNDPTVTQRNQVLLIDSASNVVGTGTVSPTGLYSVAPDTPLANGSYVFRVQIKDVAGNLSPLSDPITIEIRKLTLATPTLRLVADDDTGVVGDNITKDTTPRVQGTGDPGLFVQLIDLKGNVPSPANPGGGPHKAGDPIYYPFLADSTGSATIKVGDTGSYLAQFLGSLPDGVYELATRVSDVAGNTATSAKLTLTIQTSSSGAKPTLVLDPAFDTGAKGDNVTSSRVLRLLGTGAAAVNGMAPTVALFVAGAPATPANELARVTANADGTFVIQPPKQLFDGTVSLVAATIDVAGNYGSPSAPITIRVVTAEGDFNGAQPAPSGTGFVAAADIGSYSRNYSNGQFSIGFSPSGGYLDRTFAPGRGLVGGNMIPVEGDFDGDGVADYGVFDFSTATWTIKESTLGVVSQQMGWPGVALPVPADYDGDGRTDMVVFQPNQAIWIGRLSGGAVLNQQFGQGTDFGGRDQAVPADYDGDGKADLMLYRPQTAQWLGKMSHGRALTGDLNLAPTLAPFQFGWAGVDVAAPADYDGDGKVDLGLYRPGDGTWLVKPMSIGSGGQPIPTGGSQTRPGFAAAGDIPAPLDYDGDGKADLTVFRPGTTQWLSTSSAVNGRSFGPPDTLPLGSPLYPYRLPASQVAGTGGGVRAMVFSGGPAATTSGTGSGAGSGAAAPPVSGPAAGPAAPPSTNGLGSALGSGSGGTIGSAVGTTGNGPAAGAGRYAAALARRQAMLQRLAQRRAALAASAGVARFARGVGLAPANRPSAALALILGRRG
jgi:subtilisin-like proprotein convertase family protein